MFKKLLILSFFSTLLLFSFQNCGPSSLQTENTESLLQSNQPIYTDIPFPYKTTMNQMLYSSCPIRGSAGQSDFTFKIGAYNNDSDLPLPGLLKGGIQLNKDFLSAFEKKYSYLNEDYKNSKLREVLRTSSLTRDTQLHFSIRNSSQSRTIPVFRADPSGNSDNDLQYSSMLSPLNDEFLIDYFVKKPLAFETYFSQIKNSEQRQLEANLLVPNSGDQLDHPFYIDYMENNLLSLSFSDTKGSDPQQNDGPIPLASNPESDDYFYGKGFKFTFQKPIQILNNITSRNIRFNYPERVVDGMIEMNMENREVDKETEWNCNVQLMIVRPEERDSQIYRLNNLNQPIQTPACPKMSVASLNSNPNYKSYMLALRKMLPVDDFDINLEYGCVVPKYGNSCYSNNGAAAPVYSQYFFDVIETGDTTGKRLGCAAGLNDSKSGFLPCAHYMTFCFKTLKSK
jgi:hypothetical protein